MLGTLSFTEMQADILRHYPQRPDCTGCPGPLADSLSFLILFLSAQGLPSLLFQLLLSGCGSCEGDALGI